MNTNPPADGGDYLAGFNINNIRVQLICPDKKVPLIDRSQVTHINFDNAAKIAPHRPFNMRS